MDREQCRWFRSQTLYLDFDVYSLDEDLPDYSGVYVFACKSNALSVPLYIGSAKNLKREIKHHKRWKEALDLDMSHVHISKHIVPLCTCDMVRDDLIDFHAPVMNRFPEGR